MRIRSGVGSKFTLYHPLSIEIPASPESAVDGPSALDRAMLAALPGTVVYDGRLRHVVPTDGEVVDDRATLQPRDRVLLIIEDSAAFARILLDLARKRGFKGVVAQDGASALELAKKYRADAVTIDIRLPDMDGWQLIESLRADPAMTSIPVHVISGQSARRM